MNGDSYLCGTAFAVYYTGKVLPCGLRTVKGAGGYKLMDGFVGGSARLSSCPHI